jgi:hypothetical protein
MDRQDEYIRRGKMVTASSPQSQSDQSTTRTPTHLSPPDHPLSPKPSDHSSTRLPYYFFHSPDQSQSSLNERCCSPSRLSPLSRPFLWLSLLLWPVPSRNVAQACVTRRITVRPVSLGTRTQPPVPFAPARSPPTLGNGRTSQVSFMPSLATYTHVY